MTNSITKSTKVVCYIALIFWCLWALVFILRILRYCNIIGFNVYCGIDIAPINWFDYDDDLWAQWIVLIGYIATSAIILPISFCFIYKTIKGIKSNEIFTRSNARALKWLPAIIFFYTLFTDNLGIVYGSHEIYVSSSPIVCTVVTLIVAMLYNLAVNASEENRLTI